MVIAYATGTAVVLVVAVWSTAHGEIKIRNKLTDVLLLRSAGRLVTPVSILARERAMPLQLGGFRHPGGHRGV